MNVNIKMAGLAPFSLKDAPALIEKVFPAQKVGIEAQKERKSGSGQTLTALGAYWKGRKPLVLVRACVLASLLPATNDPQGDLELFEALMRMDTEGMVRRKAKVTPTEVANCRAISKDVKTRHLLMETVGGTPIPAKWRKFESPKNIMRDEYADARQAFDEEREFIKQKTLATMSFSQQVGICDRVESVEDLRNVNDPLYARVLARANTRLGTDAQSLRELVNQLGVARFGRRPVVGDPFTGGGSIPFEAARIGCDVIASDLNPVATMLTWGALNVIGGTETTQVEIAEEKARVASEVDMEITQLHTEFNHRGDKARAYLHCLETVDPQTGWRVPLAPSWMIGKNSRSIAKMVPVYAEKRFDLEIITNASDGDMSEAQLGSVQDGHLVYRLENPVSGENEEHRIAINRLRGDDKGQNLTDGKQGNLLRPWKISDVAPRDPEWVADATPVQIGSAPGAWRGGDIWLERLYCIQWMDGEDIKAGRSKPSTFFAAPTADDIAAEESVRTFVEKNLAEWQADGLVPDMPIEAGEKTNEPIRTRGWTHWHHLFTPRTLLLFSIIIKASRGSEHEAALLLFALRSMDYNCKLSLWDNTRVQVSHAFINQALNILYNYPSRASSYLMGNFTSEHGRFPIFTNKIVNSNSASALKMGADIWIYDPPYADAVHYHEITEFFIAWVRRKPPAPFNDWTWDSRRPLAIQGKGEKFRADMVDAFQAMADRMSEGGLQVCMFTHKDAGVWADMSSIVWASGLRVTAAWYVSTETTSELKKGGYVQGTVLLVLRKRSAEEHGYRSDIVPEVRARVAAQVETLTGLNQSAKGKGRDENLFSDADIQMAGYAAALEVLTSYTHIDGVDMAREALRPREAKVRGQKASISLVEEMIALAVQTANELMLPEDFPESLWERLSPNERFYLKMTSAEADWPIGLVGGKLDDYQNFAKAYRAEGWEDLMADRTPNLARLKFATEFRGSVMKAHAFAEGPLRPTLYAIMTLAKASEKELDAEVSSEQALHGLRDHFGDSDWLRARDSVRVIAAWLGKVWERRNPAEASAARVLTALVSSERL